jgi:hypothetical protein
LAKATLDFLKVARVGNDMVFQLTFERLRCWLFKMAFLKIGKVVSINRNWYKSMSHGSHGMGDRVS